MNARRTRACSAAALMADTALVGAADSGDRCPHGEPDHGPRARIRLFLSGSLRRSQVRHARRPGPPAAGPISACTHRHGAPWAAKQVPEGCVESASETSGGVGLVSEGVAGIGVWTFNEERS